MSDAETPAEAGKELQDPKDMSTNERATDGHTAVAQAINGFAEMNMERVGGTRYRVLSWRNDGLRVHKVNTDEVTCTCEDFKYNVADGEMEVCDHLAYAVYHAPKDREIDQEAFLNLVMALDSMNDYRNALEQRRNQMDAEADSRPSLSDTQPDEMLTPEDARERLESAYEAADGLYMKESGTDEYQGTQQVTFSIGGDDFDDVKAATSKCDMVGYNGEMNTLAVGDVDDYISEVLN